jgi:hypothetical protein
VITPERLLEDPPGEVALASLRRAGFAEPERAARELRLIAADPLGGEALRAGLGSFPGDARRSAGPGRAPCAWAMRARAARVSSSTCTTAAREPPSSSWAVASPLAEQVIRHPSGGLAHAP